MIESLQNLTQNASILKAILNFVKEKFPNLYNLFENIIGNIRAKLSRYFIISSGTGYKLNPFKKDSITFSKRPMTIWAYSRNGKPVGSTFIKYPLSLCTETYKGRQIGWMTDFSGIYIYNAKNFPEQSYTFFIGKADNVKIFELPGLFR